MYIQQLYTGCLSEAAYYIESNGEAAIIDPLRETQPYTELAHQRNAKIKYVFETHFHADFVSGHIDLAAKTGAKIIFGPDAETAYKVIIAKDNEVFTIGKIKIKVLHTPGHTLESACYLLLDENDRPHAVFSGDTLFVGDVGRPDLSQKSEITQSDLAGMMYESLKKLKNLPDNVILYPAHGAGSACGKNIGKETFSTIGTQKKVNYALQEMPKEAFIKAITEGLTPPPNYFFMDAKINMNGYENIDTVLTKNTQALSVIEFENHIANGAQILDVRAADVFESGFIKNAVNIGLNGQYAPWVGALIDPNISIVLVADEGKEKEAVLRLARVGYENVKGYLNGGILAWGKAKKPLEKINSVDAETFVKTLQEKNNFQIIDVRNAGECETGIVENAITIPLAELSQKIHTLKKKQAYCIYCAGGYRSMMASSILQKSGFENITNVRGGMSKIKLSGIALVQPVV
ncbi:MAG: MBL fold metallo-hydrolase [Bacteroidia bacterium]